MAARYPGTQDMHTTGNDDAGTANTDSGSGDSIHGLGLSDKEIRDIANALDNEMDILCLGLNLDFNRADVKRYLQTNNLGGNVSSKGTQDMIYSWAMKTSVAKQRDEMKKILDESELLAVAEKYLLKEPLRQAAMTQKEVQQCREDLVRYYCEDACKIKTSPLDPDNYLELGEIYINLELQVKKNQPTGNKTKPIPYEEITMLAARRVMIVGEAGIGKSTFCAKMAYDWATGRHFKEIGLLFFIPLSETRDQRSLGAIVKDRLSDSNEVKENQIDEYARTNPKRVLILLDGLDEFNGDAKIIKEVLESRKLQSCQVIVTTRPSKVEMISTNDRLSKIYERIHITGFSRIQIEQYVHKFFLSNAEAGSSLLQYINERGSIVSETLAPYPLYCTLLCQLWNDEKRRDVIKKFQTLSQIFGEMVYQLKEHHLSKTIGDGEKLDFTDVDACFKSLGKVAFDGLVNKKLVFVKDNFSSGDLAFAYEVGVLSTKGKVLAPRDMRKKTGKRFAEAVFFPHKLLQEYMASIHLFSCHSENPDAFKKMLKKHLLQDYMEFKYVFHFTVSHGTDIGKDTMSLLRPGKVHEDFIVDVAFELQDKKASRKFTRNLVKRDPAMLLTENMQAHTVTSYLYAMDTFNDLKKLSYWNTSMSKTLSRQAADATFTAQNVHELCLSGTNFHEDFYDVMANTAEYSKIEKVTHSHSNLSKDDSLRYALGLCNMSRLVELELHAVNVRPFFYGPFADPSNKCKIETLTLRQQVFNRATFQALLRAPSLSTLILVELKVLSRDDADLPVAMKSHVTSQVTKIDIDDSTLVAARGLGLQSSCSLVTSLTLRCPRNELTNDVIESIEFPLLGDLHIIGSDMDDTCLESSSSISRSLSERWLKLVRLAFSKVLMEDYVVENILQTARQHQFITELKFVKCFTKSDCIEAVCREIRKERKVNLDIDFAKDWMFETHDDDDCDEDLSFLESLTFDERYDGYINDNFGDNDDSEDIYYK